jgi:hypothetical protein
MIKQTYASSARLRTLSIFKSLMNPSAKSIIAYIMMSGMGIVGP